MKHFSFIIISVIMILTGCSTKTASIQDRNEILIDDLYKINKSLTQRIDTLEAQVALINKKSASKTANRSSQETRINIKGKAHDIDNSIYYGSAGRQPLSSAELPSVVYPPEKKKKSYAQRAREIDSQISTKNKVQTDSNSTQAERKKKTNKQSITIVKNDHQNQESNQNLDSSLEGKHMFTPIERFSAGVFRTKNMVELVDNNNQTRSTWKPGISFTAKEKHGNFYKVSGFFVNKQWTPASEVLLIPIESTIKR